jgi:hypothetical protein
MVNGTIRCYLALRSINELIILLQSLTVSD